MGELGRLAVTECGDDVGWGDGLHGYLQVGSNCFWPINGPTRSVPRIYDALWHCPHPFGAASSRRGAWFLADCTLSRITWESCSSQGSTRIFRTISTMRRSWRAGGASDSARQWAMFAGEVVMYSITSVDQLFDIPSRRAIALTGIPSARCK